MPIMHCVYIVNIAAGNDRPAQLASLSSLESALGYFVSFKAMAFVT